MLSDTLADNIDVADILTDINHYRKNSDIYDYNPDLLNHIEKLINELDDIRKKLDYGII